METVGTHTVVALFNSHNEAERAIGALRDRGIERENISIIAKDNKGKPTGRQNAAGTQEKTTDGTTIGENIAGGAVFGALGGLLLELAALAIPGIGPIVAAGPLATTLTGAGFGALGGGIIGAVKDMGVPDDEAHVYAESIKRGDTMVSVQTDGSHVDTVTQILNQHGAVDVDQRAASLRTAGWNKFDDTATLDAGDYAWPSSESAQGSTASRVKTYERQR